MRCGVRKPAANCRTSKIRPRSRGFSSQRFRGCGRWPSSTRTVRRSNRSRDRLYRHSSNFFVHSRLFSLKTSKATNHNEITSKMKNLLKKILTPIIEPRLVLPLLTFAAGLPSLPALAEEAEQITEAAQTEQLPTGFTEKSAEVNGVRINYKIGGQGPTDVLLHGYAETSHMWLPVMPQ